MGNQELKEKNLQTIKKYMELIGDARKERWKLFTDDATTGLQYTAEGKEMVVSGIENIRKGDQFNVKNFPDWKFTNLKYFYSDDPNAFLVECDGEGLSMLLGEPGIQHKDHYIHKFILRDGKIALYREFMNPCNELIEMGLKLPAPPVTADDMAK